MPSRTSSNREPVEVIDAAASNAAWNFSIEDYASDILEVGTSIATVQTDCGYTPPERFMEMYFSVRAASAYYVPHNSSEVEVSTPEDCPKTWKVSTMNMETYPNFVNDTMDRWQRGQMRATDLGDAARAVGLSDRSYQKPRSDERLLVGHKELAR